MAANIGWGFVLGYFYGLMKIITSLLWWNTVCSCEKVHRNNPKLKLCKIAVYLCHKGRSSQNKHKGLLKQHFVMAYIIFDL